MGRQVALLSSFPHLPPFFAGVCVINATHSIVAPQPLSPADMQAVMMASEKEMFHRHQQDAHTEMSPHQQYQAMMSGRAGQFVFKYKYSCEMPHFPISSGGIFDRFDVELEI